MVVDSICLAHDFLASAAFKDSHTKLAPRKVFPILSTLLSLLTNDRLPIRNFLDNDELALRYYGCAGLEVSQKTWATLISLPATFQQQALLLAIFSDSLVVGLDLPDSICNALTALDIPFIDFCIFPISFLHKTIFGARSNLPRLRELFRSSCVDIQQLKLEASFTIAKCAPSWQEEKVGYGHYAAFICQAQYDAQRVAGGKLLNIEDFSAEIAMICKNNPGIYALASDDSSLRDQLYLTQHFPGIVPYTGSLPTLLCDYHINSVYSISDWHCHTAQFFGKRGETFLPAHTRYSLDTITESTRLAIQSDLFDPGMWQAALASLDIPADAKNLRIPEYDLLFA